MRFRSPILTICTALTFAGCGKNPDADETPKPTPTPRPLALVTPYPRVTPWAPIRRNAGPDTTWLYRQPTPTPRPPSALKPFRSALEGASMMDNPPPAGNPQPGATPKAFHSSLDDPPQRSGGK